MYGLRRGWIVDPKLNGELLAVVDEVVHAYRVLTPVAIDDAIPAKADPMGLDTAQHLLRDADATAREPGLWQQSEKKASRFCDVIAGYRNAWEAALNWCNKRHPKPLGMGTRVGG